MDKRLFWKNSAYGRSNYEHCLSLKYSKSQAEETADYSFNRYRTQYVGRPISEIPNGLLTDYEIMCKERQEIEEAVEERDSILDRIINYFKI